MTPHRLEHLAAPGDEARVDELVTALLSASRALVGVSARSLATVEDTVTLPQFRTLVVLDTHGTTGLKQLAQRLGVQASTALRTVDRLILAGLVDRRDNESDRREVLIEVTEAGRALVEDVTSRRRTALAEIVATMPDLGRPELVEALIAFAAAADEPLVAAVAPGPAAPLGW